MFYAILWAEFASFLGYISIPVTTAVTTKTGKSRKNRTSEKQKTYGIPHVFGICATGKAEVCKTFIPRSDSGWCLQCKAEHEHEKTSCPCSFFSLFSHFLKIVSVCCFYSKNDPNLNKNSVPLQPPLQPVLPKTVVRGAERRENERKREKLKRRRHAISTERWTLACRI